MTGLTEAHKQTEAQKTEALEYAGPVGTRGTGACRRVRCSGAPAYFGYGVDVVARRGADEGVDVCRRSGANLGKNILDGSDISSYD